MSVGFLEGRTAERARRHLGGYDQQHGRDSSKCCWSPELEGQKDQDDGKLQWPSIQKGPKRHSIIKTADVI